MNMNEEQSLRDEMVQVFYEWWVPRRTGLEGPSWDALSPAQREQAAQMLHRHTDEMTSFVSGLSDPHPAGTGDDAYG
jgi:hypothetical protein